MSTTDQSPESQVDVIPVPDDVVHRVAAGPSKSLLLFAIAGLAAAGACIGGALLWMGSTARNSVPPSISSAETARLERLLDDAKAIAATSDDPSAAMVQARKLAKHAAEVSDAAPPGSSKAIATKLMGDMNTESLKLVESRNQALERLIAAGGLDATTLTTRRGIAYRKTLVADFRSACEARRRFLNNSVADFESRLRRTPIAAAEIPGWVDGYRKGLQPTKLVQMADLNLECATQMDKALGILSDHLGNWTVTADGDVIITGPRGIDYTKAFRSAMARIVETESEAKTLQDQFFEEANRNLQQMKSGQR